MKQVPNRKQCQTENSTPEIEVVTDAMPRAPLHPRKQMKCFAEMSKNNHHQTSRAETVGSALSNVTFITWHLLSRKDYATRTLLRSLAKIILNPSK